MSKQKHILVCPIHGNEIEPYSYTTIDIGRKTLGVKYRYCPACGKGYSDQLLFKLSGPRRIQNGTLIVFSPEYIISENTANQQTNATQSTNVKPKSRSIPRQHPVQRTITSTKQDIATNATNNNPNKGNGKYQWVVCPIHGDKIELYSKARVETQSETIEVLYRYCPICQKGYFNNSAYEDINLLVSKDGIVLQYTRQKAWKSIPRKFSLEHESMVEKKTGNASQEAPLNTHSQDVHFDIQSRIENDQEGRNNGWEQMGNARPEHSETQRQTDNGKVADEEKQDYGSVFREEEKRKESVYGTLLGSLESTGNALNDSRKSIDEGHYDDQDSFVLYQGWNRAMDLNGKMRTLVKSLYDRPYFSHMSLISINDDEAWHFYLSDNPDIDDLIQIQDGGVLVPFIQSDTRPMYSALFHAYQIKNDEIISVKQQGSNERIKDEYRLNLINDVEISKRDLISVHTLYPLESIHHDIIGENADEMLVEKLKENRNSTELRNIISTIQAQQFDIIRLETKESFVVQGVPGSGKTQCIIHRLFFLRDVYKDKWEYVLFITPSQLFTNYTQPLMQRFRLKDVKKTTLAGFYYTLLSCYDDRFRHRQYKIELSEEYLPDDYLREIYDSTWISKVENAIHSAIAACFTNAYELLDLSQKAQQAFTIDNANALVGMLDEKIKEFDAREEQNKENEEISNLHNQIGLIEKIIDQHRRRLHQLEKSRNDRDYKLSEYNRLYMDMEKNEADLEEWKEELTKKKEEYAKRANDAAKRQIQAKSEFDNIRYAIEFGLAVKFFNNLEQYSGILGHNSFQYEQMLNEELELSRSKLKELCGELNPQTWKARQEKSLAQIDEDIQQLQMGILKYEDELNEKQLLLESQGIDASQNKKYREALEHARYYLSRIESMVFEQQIWRTVEPLKTKYNVNSLRVEKLEDGHHRETRILYKSDLLFYLKVYHELRPAFSLPEYELICIDEGQDFHQADYSFLRKLYPKARFNVFGDLHQSVHEGCGITDWRKDTGIENVIELNVNYRNNPAIVQFCNNEFGTHMIPVGKVDKNELPILCDNEAQILNVVRSGGVLIVKDYLVFLKFCQKAGIPDNCFNFYDTYTQQVENGKLGCYSIYAAKGLEFITAAVYAVEMTENQKIVACTRALNRLFYMS